MENVESKISFLSDGISDAQETIRFIEAKTAVAITIIGVYYTAFFLVLNKIIKYSSYFSCWFWILFFSFLGLSMLCVFIIYQIIKPTLNPTINITHSESPSIDFFIYGNNYSSNISLLNLTGHKLNKNFEDYVNKIQDASETEIIQSLSFELFKVSYIRNLKTDRLKLLFLLTIVLSAIFLASYFYYSYEVSIIAEILKHPKK